jgi:hypothetical protein
MRDRTRCIYCQAVGFVRSHRSTESNAVHEFSCGQCAATWRVTDEQPEPRPERAQEKPTQRKQP